MTTPSETSRLSTQLIGAVGLTLILTVCGFLVATYQKAFVDVVDVTVSADRAGLLLDTGSRVRLSGVPVGEVREVRPGPDGRVEIALAIDEDKADLVPSNVVATIRGTTVFGSKFVSLAIPDDAPEAPAIADGDVINASSVTIEVNDVFDRGLEVLEAVDPVALNGTLTAVSTALRGRGDDFGRFFSDWNDYLSRLEPHLDALEYVLKTSPAVLGTYVAAAPDLIDAADSFATTSHTIVARKDEFTRLLTGAVDGANAARKFLLAVEAPLISFNREWLPVLRLLAEYSPEFGCVIKGLDRHREVFASFFGNPDADEHYFYAKTGFLPGQEKYSMAKYAPKIVTGVGPVCYPETTAANPTPPRVRFDDGSLGIYTDSPSGQPVNPADPPLALYNDLLAGWLGVDGANALLEGIQ